MDWGVVILTILAIALVIIAIVSLLLAHNTQDQPPEEHVEHCSSLTEGLKPITRCSQGGTVYDAALFMNLDTVPVPYTSVCRQFCPFGGYDKNNDRCYTLPSETEEYARFKACIDNLKPIDCVGPARPVAVDGTIPYYGQSINLSGC